MRIRSPDRLLGFPSGFPLGMVPPKNLDERNSLFPHDSVLTICNGLRMTIETHNWSSSAHQELHKIVRDENFPILNQVDARVQNFEIQFLKEAAKFVGDFKSLANEADASLVKHMALELDIEHLQTELERTKERFENCIIKKENEYAKLWNDWYKECDECKYDKISYDKAYKDMQQKIERLQVQLGDLKGKSKDTSCVSDTRNPLSQKLENENVELEFQVSDQKDNTHDTSANTKFAKQPIVENLPNVGETHALSKPVTSNSVSTPQESKVVKNDKKCLISVNHDECLRNYVNGKTSRGKKQKAKVYFKENQMQYQPKVTKPKKVGFLERLATPKPGKPRVLLRWSPTGRLFDQEGKLVASSESESQSDYSNGDNACTSNAMEPTIKQFPNSTSLLDRNASFVRNLEGVDLLKGDRSTNLYTINLHEIASASPICLMARASSTKSWLWHQRLSHLNFDTINDLSRNDLVSGLPKFKYHKEHLCPSCEQGKSKRASHPPKPVPNSRQRLHLLHMDLCGPMRIASINGKRYVLVIVDDYSRYTWVHFLRSKDEAPAVIITFLKRSTVLFQSPIIIIRTDNGTEFKNHVLKEYFDAVGISHQMSYV
nr:integrase, catalytic region, zinc finger, CCHC-type, peptidase aspartic, catalytic [Tanacetum cinerariifolium]